MGRIISIIISVALVFSTLPIISASTADAVLEVISASEEKTEILLATDSAMSGNTVLIRVFIKGQDTTLNNLVWAEEGRVDSEGKCSFFINMQGFESETYHFLATIYGVEYSTECELIFYNKEEKQVLWEKVKAAVTNKTDSDILWIAENRGDYLQLNVDKFNLLISQENELKKFYKRLYAAKTESLEDFVDNFNNTLNLIDFSKASYENAVVMLDEMLDKNGIKSTAAYEDYNADTDLQKNVCEKMQKQEFAADSIKNAFETTVILQLLNSNKELWKAYASVLSKYRAEIGIDFAEYDEINNQAEIIYEMIEETEEFVTLSDVKQSFEDCCEDAEYTPHFGGGGSGGGGGKVSAPKISTVTDEEKTEEKVNAVSEKFIDMEQATWAQEAVYYLAERGILNGIGDNLFAPDKKVTRAEMAKILVLASDIVIENSKVPFEDVNEGAWYYPYVSAAYAHNLINGFSDTVFAPDSFITRQDLAVMVSRILESDDLNKNIEFADEENIAPYAKPAVQLLAAKGIVSGRENNCFDPLAGATRAEMAKIIFEVLKNGGGIEK
ncbi:MAG: S-layer homology domain-containing protein [Clostridia bacterium]|nr:S-layer homology domain-containing protein [Clostridia bacterium]